MRGQRRGRTEEGGLAVYLRRTHEWRSAVMLTVPLFAVYEAGLLLFTHGEVRNAADQVLRDLFHLGGARGTIVLNSVVLCLFLAAALARPRREPVFRHLPLLVLECSIYAALLVPVTSLVVTLARGLMENGPAAALVLSLGAGLYEEVIFRLVAVSGLYALLHRGLGLRTVWAASAALLLSSLLFAAYHHVGPGGEVFVRRVFAFRFLAGMLLGWLFLLRGFAVSCWSHALYDVMVVLSA